MRYTSLDNISPPYSAPPRTFLLCHASHASHASPRVDGRLGAARRGGCGVAVRKRSPFPSSPLGGLLLRRDLTARETGDCDCSPERGLVANARTPAAQPTRQRRATQSPRDAPARHGPGHPNYLTSSAAARVRGAGRGGAGKQWVPLGRVYCVRRGAQHCSTAEAS